VTKSGVHIRLHKQSIWLLHPTVSVKYRHVAGNASVECVVVAQVGGECDSPFVSINAF